MSKKLNVAVIQNELAGQSAFFKTENDRKPAESDDSPVRGVRNVRSVRDVRDVRTVRGVRKKERLDNPF